MKRFNYLQLGVRYGPDGIMNFFQLLSGSIVGWDWLTENGWDLVQVVTVDNDRVAAKVCHQMAIFKKEVTNEEKA